MKNRINDLINRATALQEKCIIAPQEIHQVEESLKVVLSNDFKEIALRYGYSIWFSFHLFPDEVIESTRALRDQGLPNNYICLEEDDCGMSLIETQDSPEKPSPVMWCDIPDVYNLLEGKPLEHSPTIFPSFTDFFEYLIEQEEKDRAEDEALATTEKEE